MSTHHEIVQTPPLASSTLAPVRAPVKVATHLEANDEIVSINRGKPKTSDKVIYIPQRQ